MTEKDKATDAASSLDFTIPGDYPSTYNLNYDVSPYHVENGGILVTVETKNGSVDKVVCNFTAEITKEIISEDGETDFTISGQTGRGRPFTTNLHAEDFVNAHSLVARITKAGGALAIVYERMKAHVAPAIQSFSACHEVWSRYTRTGWADGRFLIARHHPDRTCLDLPSQCPYDLNPAANLENGLDALDALANSQAPEVALPALVGLFLAPAAFLAGWRNYRYATMIYGVTGSFKTSFAKVAMSLYGAAFLDDGALLKWNEGATTNALLDIATHAHDVPFLIDNYKPNAGGGKETFVTTMHALVEGGGKARLNRETELQAVKPIYAWPVITGEDLPETDGATLARMLVIPFAADRALLPNLTRAQELAPHMSAVGRAWITWLESEDSHEAVGEVKGLLDSVRRRWRDLLVKANERIVNPDRVATSLAINELTGRLIGACPATKPFYEKYEAAHIAGLETIAVQMAQQTAETVPALRFIEGLNQLIASGNVVILDRLYGKSAENARKTVVGYRDEDGVYILPAIAIKAVDTLLHSAGGLQGVTTTMLYRQLAKLNLLANTDAAQTTVNVQVGTGDSARTTRVLRFSPDVFGFGAADSRD